MATFAGSRRSRESPSPSNSDAQRSREQASQHTLIAPCCRMRALIRRYRKLGPTRSKAPPNRIFPCIVSNLSECPMPFRFATPVGAVQRTCRAGPALCCQLHRGGSQMERSRKGHAAFRGLGVAAMQSDFETVEERIAELRAVLVFHFHEVVLQTGLLRRLEQGLPVNHACADRHHLFVR
jgi:hypothetical protein